MNLSKELGIFGPGKIALTEKKDCNRRNSRTIRRIVRAARRSVRNKMIREGVNEMRMASR